MSGANADATSIGTMHAGATGKEPVQLSRSLHFPELHLEPSPWGEVRRVFVAARVDRFFPRALVIFVPLFAGCLTATAGSTSGSII